MNSLIFQLCSLFLLLTICESSVDETYVFHSKFSNFLETNVKENNETSESFLYHILTKPQYKGELKGMLEELESICQESVKMMKNFRISEIQGDDPFFNMTFLHTVIWLTAFVCTLVFIKR